MREWRPRCGATAVVLHGLYAVIGMAAASTAGTVLDSLLMEVPPSCRTVVEDAKNFNLQVIYTKIDRDRLDRPSFVNYTFNVNPQQYFYPASLVKLPVAALALEKINGLKIQGLTRGSPMAIDSPRGCAVHYDSDENAPPGSNRSSIESSIKRMLLVSDNGGFNRLWEFLTRDRINRELTRHGFGGIRLLHRLAPCTPDQNSISNGVHFFSDLDAEIYSQQPVKSRLTIVNPCAPLTLGFGTMVPGTLYPQPLKADNFNYVALADLHRFLIGIMFPRTIDGEKRFALTKEDYRLLRTWMCLLPRESGSARYDTAEVYPDRFKKYLLYGMNDRPVAPDLREFNVVGKAYGFMSDVAYFADFKTGVEFFLSATIYVNADGVMNDDEYDYETIALPFFNALTSVIYNYELSRSRKYKPDLRREFEPDTVGITIP
jgi:hypothetical protein